MATVKAIIKPNKLNKEGKAPIVIRVTHNGSNTTFTIQRAIEPKYWNANSTRSKVRSNCPGAAKLNLRINRVVKEVEELIDSKASNNFTAKSIVKDYLNKDVKDSPTQVYALIKEYINLNPDNISHITLKTYNKVNNCVFDYDPNCDINDIDLEWIKKYEKFLSKKGKAINTIYDRMKILRKITKRAYEKGLIAEFPFKFYKAKTEESQREYLTKEELKVFEAYKPKNRSESICKDIFLFSCYTGLRFSDMCTLSTENFKQEEKVIMSLRMQKTNTLIQFPIPDRAVDILEKYNGRHYSLPIIKYPINDYIKLKTKISSRNAYFNKVLKGIILESEIDKGISFHCARHTFATIGLTLGIRIEVLQRLLGHKNIRETQIYAKIVDEQKSEAIDLWNNM